MARKERWFKTQEPISLPRTTDIIAGTLVANTTKFKSIKNAYNFIAPRADWGEPAVSYKRTGWSSSRLQIILGEFIDYIPIIKENRRMSTCNRLNLQTLGFQPVIMPKSLPDHWPRGMWVTYTSMSESARVTSRLDGPAHTHPTWWSGGSLGFLELEILHGGILQQTTSSLIVTYALFLIQAQAQERS